MLNVSPADKGIMSFRSTTPGKCTPYRPSCTAETCLDAMSWLGQVSVGCTSRTPDRAPSTCPTLQIWWLLEEKRIPYTMEKINMRSYGDKPESFLQKVPSGLLPVIELDGRVYTESMDIMMLLEQVCSPSPTETYTAVEPGSTVSANSGVG